MIRLTEVAHQHVALTLHIGDVAVDATAGNGHDTQFLAQLVGPTGRVFAIDIQPTAIARTQIHISTIGCSNVTLICGDHAQLQHLIPLEYREKIAVVMFNLGYLPDASHHIITQAETTIAALEAAIELLASGGLLTVMAYPGHPGGEQETEAVAYFLTKHTAINTNVVETDTLGKRTSPKLYICRKYDPSTANSVSAN